MRKSIRTAAAAIGGIFCAALVFLVTLFIAHKSLPASDLDRVYFDVFYDVPLEAPKGQLIAFGDSIAFRAPWPLLFPFRSIENLGIIGESTQMMLRRVPEVKAAHPEETVILAGINDIRQGRSQDAWLGDYSKILHAFADVSKRVVVVSVLPTQTRSYRNTIESANSRIRRLCGALPNCKFVDGYAALSVQGYLPDENTKDGLHLSLLGYWRLRSVLIAQGQL
jgi:hypothetical protein